MPKFQGSGFLLDLPEGCTDASTYTFLLPTEGSFTPYITIKSEQLDKSQDLKVYVDSQQDKLKGKVEDHEIIHYATGKRLGMDVILTTIAWGVREGRVCQKIAYFLVKGEKGNKVFTLTGTDLASQFKKSEPLFEQAFKAFMPNQVQLLEA
jgi:hypothetical protein